MPQIDEILNAIGQLEYLTTLDLTKGSWQVLLDEVDKEKTAFANLLGLLKFVVMAVGLSGAQATFQQLMDNILRGTKEYAGGYTWMILLFVERLGKNILTI